MVLSHFPSLILHAAFCYKLDTIPHALTNLLAANANPTVLEPTSFFLGDHRITTVLLLIRTIPFGILPG